MPKQTVSIIADSLPGSYWTERIRAANGRGNMPASSAKEMFGLTRREFQAVREGQAQIGGTYGEGYTLEPVLAVEPRGLTIGANEVQAAEA